MQCEFVSYDNGLLTVRFSETANVYSYNDVPQEVADGFRNADDKGKFFREHISQRLVTPQIQGGADGGYLRCPCGLVHRFASDGTR